jgi:hypothetical protein
MPPLLRTSWAWATVGPAFPLAAYLGIALLLRLPAVLLADGYEYADQQYQYVDPAWALSSGDAWLPTWEWDEGMRSWTYPGFLAGLFTALRSLGLEEPFWLMRAVRLVHALVSLLPLAFFWLLLVRWRPIAAPRLPLLLLAATGYGVATGVQPSGPALGATLAVAGVIAFHGPRLLPLLGGLLLGLAFCARPQEALFGPAVVAVGLWQRRHAATALFAAGCVPGVIVQGFVDLATWGTFLSSPWRYLEVNVVEGAAERFRTQPFWFYAAALIPVLMLLPPWTRAALGALRRGAAILPAALAAGLLHVLAHSLLDRKALRFEYGAFYLLVAVVAAGLLTARDAPDAVSPRRRIGHAVALLALHVVALGWATFVGTHVGPVRAADFLRRQADFTGELLVVGGSATSVGGAYYLRRSALTIDSVQHERAAAHLAALPRPPRHVLSVRKPLDPDLASRFDLLGAFHDTPDLTRADRRWVYRSRP